MDEEPRRLGAMASPVPESAREMSCWPTGEGTATESKRGCVLGVNLSEARGLRRRRGEGDYLLAEVRIYQRDNGRKGRRAEMTADWWLVGGAKERGHGRSDAQGIGEE